MFLRDLGVALGITNSGAGIGQFVAAPLLQLAIDNYGLSHALIMLGAISTLCLVSGLLMSQEASRTFKPSVSKEKANSFSQNLRVIISSPQLVLLFVYTRKTARSISDHTITYNIKSIILLFFVLFCFYYYIPIEPLTVKVLHKKR